MYGSMMYGVIYYVYDVWGNIYVYDVWGNIYVYDVWGKNICL